MATKLPDIFDVPDAGQSGEFALCRAGGGLYFAVIANGGDGGRLFVGPVGGQPAKIDLGPLGVSGALSVRLDGHGPGGTLVAYIKRIIDTDGQDRGRRVITPVETGIAVGAQEGPVDPPAPPGAAVGLPAVLQAIAAARGPLDGKDAEFNSLAGVHNGVDATYDLAKRQTGTILDELAAARDFRSAAWQDDGLPPELVANLGSQWQRDLAFTVVTLLEFILRLEEFPRRDGGTILRT